jgi:hypothetical protein
LKLVTAVRKRYDGSRRNPFNEIECGDHYSRALSGWAVLEAFTRSSYDALTGHLRLGRRVPRYPLFAGAGWGEIVISGGAIELQCHGGEIEIRSLSIADGAPGRLALNGNSVPIAEAQTLRAEDVFTVELEAGA